METKVLQKFQSSLLEKRRLLTGWLKQTPDDKKQMVLGPENEGDVTVQVDVLDRALSSVEDRTLGCCEICQGEIEHSLLEMDYTTRVCLEHFSDRERSQLESELEFLQAIQQALLPQGKPEIPKLDLAVFSRPAQIVSGDYFDFFRYQDEGYGLVVADAMGHGVSASLLMSSLQTALRALVPENNSPVDVLKRVNRLFLHNINFTTFVTVLLCRFDPNERLVTYVNAGHNPPLVYRKQADTVTWLPPTGAAIGLAESYDLAARTLALSEGDILFLYTDGATEATNSQDEAFSRERLAAVVHENAGLSAEDLVWAARSALNDFIGSQALADDVTLLACKIDG